MPVQGCDVFDSRSPDLRPHHAGRGGEQKEWVKHMKSRLSHQDLRSRPRRRRCRRGRRNGRVRVGRQHHARTAADHKCPIATGSGDAAFVKNFNPFNNGASRDFTWGGIYENLLVTTAFGGGNSYNVLAKSLAYSKDGKTLNITIVPNAKWSNGKPVTAQDVAYSLSDRQAGQGSRPDRSDRREQQHQVASR